MHGGLAWGVKVAPDSGTQTEIMDRIAGCLRYREWSVWMDGSHELAPPLSLHGQGMSRNGWACLDRPSDYFPSHQPLAEEINQAGAWLTDLNGTILPLTSGGLRRFDIRYPSVRDFFVDQTAVMLALYGCPFLFLDECHGHEVPGSLTGRDMNQPILGVEGSFGWNDTMRTILRRTRAKTVINGTFPLDQSAMICGFYVQNAHLKASLLDRLRDSVSRGYTRTCIQVPVARSLEFQELASRFGAFIQEIPATGGQFDCPPPAVYCEPGTKLTRDGNTLIVGRT